MMSEKIDVDAQGVVGLVIECEECFGSGVDYGETCTRCGGLGWYCEPTVSADKQ